MGTSHDPIPCQWGAWISYDEHSPAWTEEGFRYWRECEFSGCYRCQRVEQLVPTGKSEEWDPKDSVR
jgi:hypothetical protein